MRTVAASLVLLILSTFVAVTEIAGGSGPAAAVAKVTAAAGPGSTGGPWAGKEAQFLRR